MKYLHQRLRTLSFISAMGIAISVISPPVHADSPKAPSNTPNSSTLRQKIKSSSSPTGKWFVQLSEKPSSKGGSAKTISAQHKALSQAVPKGVKVTDSYSKVWNGVTVKADDKHVNELAKAKNVKAIFPVLTVDRPKEPDQKSAKPDLHTAGNLTGVSYARNELGLTGKGVKIGIIDTGIDIDHPAFGGSGKPGSSTFPTAKVIAGYDFVGDKYNTDTTSAGYDPNPVPDSVPDDCGGHGTHVASIAAGNDTAKKIQGVAPDARLGAYRVFGCEGSTDTDIMLQAMEQAAKDGMDVVNISIGSSFMSWPNYPTAVGADNMADSGIVVTASAGNSGTDGVFSTGAPSVGDKVMSVGSVDNTHVHSSAFKGPDGHLTAYTDVDGSPKVPTKGKIELAAYPEGKKTGGVDLDGTPFNGKAVLISRGDIPFYQKAIAAQNDGASAVIIYNNEEGTLGASLTGKPAPHIPVIGITQAEGKKLEAAVAAGSASIEWTPDEINVPDPNAGAISTFSAYGLSADLTTKPDVMAPGGNIYAAVPISKQGDNAYGMKSGTSMAAPHAAGASALVLQSNTTLNPNDVRTVLQNSAKPLSLQDPENDETGSSANIKEPIHRQGAGLIDIPAAVSQAHSHTSIDSEALPSLVTPSRISLGDTDSNGPTQVSIANRSDKEVTYELSSDTSPVGTGGPNSRPKYFAGLNTKVTFSTKKITVPAHSTRTVEVTVTPPSEYTDGGVSKELPWATIYGGYVVVTGSNNVTEHIPFTGLNADYESLGFIRSKWTYGDIYDQDELNSAGVNATDPLNIQPSLGKVLSCPSGRVVGVECGDQNTEYAQIEEDDHVYSIKDYDVPRVLMHIENPVSKLEIAAYHATDKGTKGKPIAKNNIVYHSDGEGADANIQTFTWDGTADLGDEEVSVADGRYVLEVTVTKGTGHAQNGKNTEVYTTRPFRITSKKPNPSPTPSPSASPTASPTATPTVSPSGDGSSVTMYSNWTEASALPPTLIGPGTAYRADTAGAGKDSVITRNAATFTTPTSTFVYGRPSDTVLTGDWDGDGKDTVAVVRAGRIYIKNTLTAGDADTSFAYGRPSDTYLAGDWDGDGKDTIAVRRGNVYYLKNSLAPGNADVAHTFAHSATKVLTGNWTGSKQHTPATQP